MHKSHVKRVETWMKDKPDEQILEHSQQKPKDSQSKFPKPQSTSKIPFSLPTEVRKVLLNGEFPEICTPTILSSNCYCGSTWKDADEYFCNGLLYTASKVLELKVRVRWCNKSKCRAYFDGAAYGIFNYSGLTMVTYDVLEDYITCALTSGMTLAAFCLKKS